MSYEKILKRFAEHQKEELSLLSSLEGSLASDLFSRILEKLYRRRQFKAIFQGGFHEKLPPEKKKELLKLIEDVLKREEEIKKKLLELSQKIRQKQQKLTKNSRVIQKYRSLSP
ncbi:MAG: hypothetical protein GXO17_04860 [Thermodesulfobacteria bacterium]|nr:hypothetical protein [Thermodesulfobacteriota bacterium]